MIVSTKGRYALRVMIDLAQQDSDKYIALKDVADRQDISIKYLELIVPSLNKGGLILSQRGKAGGYRLARKPSGYTIWEILMQAEGPLTPVNCLGREKNLCQRSDTCMTLPMWQKLEGVMKDYLEGITLEDLLQGRV